LTSSSNSSEPPSRQSSPNPISALLNLIWRLLLLVGGGGVAVLIGMALAQRFATTTPQQPPLVEQWRQQLFSPDPPAEPNFPTSPSPAVEIPKTTLTSQKRQQLQTQLQQLQQEYNQLIGRTSQLEQQLGNTRPLQPLEMRLEILAQQLDAANNGDVVPDTPNTDFTAASKHVGLSENVLSISLPSDFLFENQSVTLKEDTNAILDNLLAELRNYPRSTVLIGAYTDSQPQQKALDFTFQQATAIAEYLQRELSSQYRWIVLGYGSTGFAASGETATTSAEGTANPQTQRRIEVKILPYS